MAGYGNGFGQFSGTKALFPFSVIPKVILCSFILYIKINPQEWLLLLEVYYIF